MTALTAEIVLSIAIPKPTHVIATRNSLSNYALMARVAKAEDDVTWDEILCTTDFLIREAHRLSEEEQFKVFNVITLLKKRRRELAQNLKKQSRKL